MSTSSNDWTEANDAVRDLHRELATGGTRASGRFASATFDDLALSARHRLYPEVGTASLLARPGGFRRAFLAPALSEGTAQQVSSLQVTKWNLIEDAYLLADVQAVLLPTDTESVQTDPQSANFRLLLERPESSWVLLDLVPITKPRIVEI